MSRQAENDFTLPIDQMEKLSIGSASVPMPKKPISNEGRKTVAVETNVYRHKIEPKTIYAYDVAMSLHTSNGEVVDLIFRGNNNIDITNRPKLCMNLVQTALQSYRIISGEFVVYDGAACLYSTGDLTDKLSKHRSILQVDLAELPHSVASQHVHVTDVTFFVLEITKCREMPTLNTRDYVKAQTNRDFDVLDRTFRQFFDLLTSQDALIDERFMALRQGKLYLVNGPHQDLRCGHEQVKGVAKGTKFVTNGQYGVIPALVIDSKLGDFFKAQCVKTSITELINYMGYRGERFPWDSTEQFVYGERKMLPNKYWKAADQFIRGLQMERIGSEVRKSNFTALGLTKVPISQVTEDNERSEGKRSIMEKFRGQRLNTDWPAVVFKGVNVRTKVVFFFHYPMELLNVKQGQGVPYEKQIASPTGAVGTVRRFNDIREMLRILNLDEGGQHNKLMKAFGVSLEKNPIFTEALIREKPTVQYHGRTVQVEQEGNWKSNGIRFLVPAELTTVFVLGREEKLLMSVKDTLQGVSRQRGMNVNWKIDYFFEDNADKTYKKLQDLFHKIKDSGDSKRTLVLLIDDERKETHGVLKLAERNFLIRTMHMLPKTAASLTRSRLTCSNIVNKLNEKCGGVNHGVIPDKYSKTEWNNSTMFIGYDVSHPTGESRNLKMNRAPPTTPSTIGFSFNGGKDISAFIGDFHFQKPLQERVESSILTDRTKWMLNLFMKNRGCAPKVVHIIRDGVSEGQYAMVMKEELTAIKAAFSEFKNAKKIDSMPTFNIYIVTKRHNVRMVTRLNRANIEAGSFVSKDIVRNDLPEFFMHSHKVIKAPSIQNIVDERKTSLEQDQSMFHALAYCHKIVDSPISMPEPVYMADEYAKRGKNLFKAFREQHNFPKLTDYNREEYREAPIDFEKLTHWLSYWNTSLEEYRVNA